MGVLYEDAYHRRCVIVIFIRTICHSERSEDELLRTLSKNLKSVSLCIQILRVAQDDRTL